MAKNNERTYTTRFSEETITMDKYNQLLLDIARLIADTDRENFLLKCDLENTKAQLAAAEDRIAHAEKRQAAAEDQLERVVAERAVEMMKEEGKRGA